MWWHSDLCFLQVGICILMDLNWISVNLSTKHCFSQSAHFGALASMWEVLVGKHWDLQPRLPCLLPLQPGLFKICACGSFYYCDLYATGKLMYWYLYLLKSLQSLQWICTGDTSCKEKKKAMWSHWGTALLWLGWICTGDSSGEGKNVMKAKVKVLWSYSGTTLLWLGWICTGEAGQLFPGWGKENNHLSEKSRGQE